MARPVLDAKQYGWLALALFALTAYGCILPFNYRPLPLDEAIRAFSNISHADSTELGARGDWVVSVLQFMALSFVLMGMLAVDRPRLQARLAAPLVALLCAGLSVSIEFVQLQFPPRTVSINDLVFQAAGGVIGTVTWLVAGQRITRWLRRLSSVVGVAGLSRRLWPGYLALLVIVQLMPFDFAISTAELAAKYDEGKFWLVPFAHVFDRGGMDFAAKLAIHFLCFAPLGFLRVLSLEQASSAPSRWRRVVLFGLGVTAAIECLQMLVYSRFCDTTDIITGTAAVALGWYAGELFRAHWQQALVDPEVQVAPRWHPLTWCVLFLVWFAVMLYFNWRPFDFSSDPAEFTSDSENFPLHGMRRFSWLPLVEYYWGSKYNLLDLFLKKALSFVPLGVLVTLSRRKLYQPGVGLGVVLAALVLSALVEVGRYFLPTRIPSVTDVLISCTGAWLGYALTQHIRVVFWAERTLFSYVYQMKSPYPGPHDGAQNGASQAAVYGRIF
jgi:glycopeptide antibiotics resistance protein